MTGERIINVVNSYSPGLIRVFICNAENSRVMKTLGWEWEKRVGSEGVGSINGSVNYMFREISRGFLMACSASNEGNKYPDIDVVFSGILTHLLFGT